MLVSVALFSGFTSVSTVPAGSFAKAALVGANTVNGPLPSRVSTRPAAFTAATSVVWCLEFTAFWMMCFHGYIAPPPPITVFSSPRAGATKVEVRGSALKATAENRAIRLDMEGLPMLSKPADIRRDKVATTALSLVLFQRRRCPNYGAVFAAVSENNSL